MHLAELAIEVTQQNEEYHSEVTFLFQLSRCRNGLLRPNGSNIDFVGNPMLGSAA